MALGPCRIRAWCAAIDGQARLGARRITRLNTLEVELRRPWICDRLPSAERVCFTNSGTRGGDDRAISHRAARVHTGREAFVVKFREAGTTAA
jgi:glutamate-1-semialdehyde aminotransferase